MSEDYNYRCEMLDGSSEYDNLRKCKSYKKITYKIDLSGDIHEIYKWRLYPRSDILIDNIDNKKLFLDEFFKFLSRTNVVELKLSFSEINFDIAEYLSDNKIKELKKINIECKSMGNLVGRSLKRFLDTYVGLEELKIKSISMINDNMMTLGRYIARNVYLRKLSLRNNNFDMKHLRILCRALSLNERIEIVKIKDNNLEKSDMLKTICGDLMYNKNIKDMKIAKSRNRVEPSFRSWYRRVDRHENEKYNMKYDLGYFFKSNRQVNLRTDGLFTLLCCLRRNGLYKYVPKFIRKLIGGHVDIYNIEDKINCVREIYEKEIMVDRSVLPYKYRVVDK